jgi:hypothetical protein
MFIRLIYSACQKLKREDEDKNMPDVAPKALLDIHWLRWSRMGAIAPYAAM